MRFEASHRAEDCLADAYERLVPILRRSLSPATPPQQVDHPHSQRSLSLIRTAADYSSFLAYIRTDKEA